MGLKARSIWMDETRKPFRCRAEIILKLELEEKFLNSAPWIKEKGYHRTKLILIQAIHS